MRADVSRRAFLGLAATGLTSGCLRLSERQDEGAAGDATSGPNGDAATQGGADTTGADESTTVAGDVDYPTGVEPDGVSAAVVLEHRSAVSGKSLTVTQRDVDQYATRTKQRRVGTDAALVTRDEGPSTVESYFSEDGQFVRGTFEGETLYGYNPGERFHRERFLRLELVRALVDTGNYAPTGTETVDGTTYVVAEADGKESDALASRRGGGTVESFEGTLRVSTDGVIESVTATYSLSNAQNSETRQLELRFSAIGATDVSRPDWTATARERAPRFEVSVVDDGRFVRVEHTGGVDVPRANVGMYQRTSGGASRFTEVESGIASGDVLYLHKSDSEGGLAVAKNERPSASPEPFSGEWGVDVFAGPLTLHEAVVTA